LNKNALSFIKSCESKFGVEAIITREDIAKICNESGAPMPYWLVTKSEYRFDRGQYKVPPSGEKIVKLKEKIVNLNEADCKVNEPETEMAYAQPAQVLEFRQPKLVDDSDPAVPQKWPDYVPFGFYKDMKNIIGSKAFYPIFVTGL
jgi:hypothetical protein